MKQSVLKRKKLEWLHFKFRNKKKRLSRNEFKMKMFDCNKKQDELHLKNQRSKRKKNKRRILLLNHHLQRSYKVKFQSLLMEPPHPQLLNLIEKIQSWLLKRLLHLKFEHHYNLERLIMNLLNLNKRKKLLYLLMQELVINSKQRDSICTDSTRMELLKKRLLILEKSIWQESLQQVMRQLSFWEDPQQVNLQFSLKTNASKSNIRWMNLSSLLLQWTKLDVTWVCYYFEIKTLSSLLEETLQMNNRQMRLKLTTFKTTSGQNYLQWMKRKVQLDFAH